MTERKNLTEKEVAKIKKALVAGNQSQSQIAEKFGVCVATIAHINTGRTWQGVDVPGWEDRTTRTYGAKKKTKTAAKKKTAAKTKKKTSTKTKKKTAAKAAEAAKRKPGRPKKVEAEAPKKPRGRPKKVQEAAPQEAKKSPGRPKKAEATAPNVHFGQVFESRSPQNRGRRLTVIEVQDQIAFLYSNGKLFKVNVAALAQPTKYAQVA